MYLLTYLLTYFRDDRHQSYHYTYDFVCNYFVVSTILRINGMAPFCNLFMEQPSYNKMRNRQQ